jgi:hypothetical protein
MQNLSDAILLAMVAADRGNEDALDATLQRVRELERNRDALLAFVRQVGACQIPEAEDYAAEARRLTGAAGTGDVLSLGHQLVEAVQRDAGMTQLTEGRMGFHVASFLTTQARRLQERAALLALCEELLPIAEHESQDTPEMHALIARVKGGAA